MNIKECVDETFAGGVKLNIFLQEYFIVNHLLPQMLTAKQGPNHFRPRTPKIDNLLDKGGRRRPICEQR